MLKIDISPNETVQIGTGSNAIFVTMEKKTGQVARLSFSADKSIPIKRVEAAKRSVVGITGIAG